MMLGGGSKRKGAGTLGYVEEKCDQQELVVRGTRVEKYYVPWNSGDERVE